MLMPVKIILISMTAMTVDVRAGDTIVKKKKEIKDKVI